MRKNLRDDAGIAGKITAIKIGNRKEQHI